MAIAVVVAVVAVVAVAIAVALVPVDPVDVPVDWLAGPWQNSGQLSVIVTEELSKLAMVFSICVGVWF